MVDPLGPLTPRVRRLSESHQLRSVEQIAARYPERLLAIRGFGFKALREVEHHVIPGQPHYVMPPAVQPLYCACPICWRD